MSCNAQDLATVRLFELFDQDELTELAAVIDSEKASAGQMIFRAGILVTVFYRQLR